MNIFGLCGSLRASSLNAAVLRTAADSCLPPDVEMEIYPDLSVLPYFNQDVEQAGAPEVVLDLRARVGAADGVLIASPEYAHGTSGVLKNALEWLVGGGEMDQKPVALISASPGPGGGNRAQAWLRETLAMLGARVLDESLAIPAASIKVRDGRLVDPATLGELESLVKCLAVAAQA